MEHKLITGGEQWLPFARSRIKALRATGLRYATQRFEIDGAHVEVRIEDLHEYIVIRADDGSAYLESGQLNLGNFAPASPTKYDPAEWNFLDIPPNSTFLGAANAKGKQNNNPDLTEDAESQAIGYPQVKGTPEDIEAKRAEHIAKYGDLNILKKLIASSFPASVFSGKMRLFMQSTYGARTKDKYPLSVELVGESLLLYYTGRGEPAQLGFWVHKTPGIFTAPDGTYWLLDVSMASGRITTTYRALEHSASVAPFLARLKKEVGLSVDERTKLEAYVFANSTLAETHRSTATDGCAGGTIAYGWKFNTDGSKAAAVVHELVNGDTATARWRSRTVTVSFHYDADIKTITAVSSITVNGDWIDGWGAFNIFVPESDLPSARLTLYSLKAFSQPTPESFDFGATPIYGYYKDDSWVNITVAATTTVAASQVQSDTGLTYNYNQNMNEFPRWGFGFYPADSTWTYEGYETVSGSSMTLAVDGNTYLGRVTYGVRTEVTAGATTAGGVTSDYINSFPPTLTSGSAGPYSGVGVFIYPESYPLDISPDAFPLSGNYVASSLATWTKSTRITAGQAFDAWVLAIPSGDAEAAYASTYTYDAPDTITHVTETRTNVVVGIRPRANSGGVYPYVPWQGAGSIPGWFLPAGTSSVLTSTSDTTPRPPAEVKVYCFNKIVSGTQGTPGGSYETLYACDRNNPFYARGMYTHTGAGGRYIMSEGATVPDSVKYADRFVGWA